MQGQQVLCILYTCKIYHYKNYRFLLSLQFLFIISSTLQKILKIDKKLFTNPEDFHYNVVCILLSRPLYALLLILYFVLIGLTQLKPGMAKTSNLSDRNSCILVPTKEQEGNQYGSSRTDHLRRLSEAVQDRGSMSEISVPSTLPQRLCLPQMWGNGVLSYLPPQSVPV